MTGRGRFLVWVGRFLTGRGRCAVRVGGIFGGERKMRGMGWWNLDREGKMRGKALVEFWRGGEATKSYSVNAARKVDAGKSSAFTKLA